MTDSTKLYFEDIKTGMTFTTGSITIDAAEIRSFARKFDPQPYHLDRDAADASLFGGLCASGWHVCALMMRMLSDCLDDAGFVMLGNDNVPWLQWRTPVFENDILRATVSVADCAAGVQGDEDDQAGDVACDVTVLNQTDKPVMILNTVLRVARRNAATSGGGHSA
jgi:acyl dehydratase